MNSRKPSCAAHFSQALSLLPWAPVRSVLRLARHCILRWRCIKSQARAAVRAQALVRKCGWQINRATEWASSAPMAPAEPELRVLAGLETLDYGSCQGMKSISAGIYHRTARSEWTHGLAECMKVFNDLRDMSRNGNPVHSLAELTQPEPDYAQASERCIAFRTSFGCATAMRWKPRLAPSSRPGLQEGRLDAPHRGVFRGLANAHRPGKMLLQRHLCCSTNPPTTSTSKPATGSKTISQLPPRLRAHFPRPFLPDATVDHNRRNLEQAHISQWHLPVS